MQVTFEAASCTADAIQRAAYRLCDRIAVEFLLGADDRFSCTIFAVDGTPATSELAASFRIEVTDQVLRERIRNETEAVRNVILALAFSNTGLCEQ